MIVFFCLVHSDLPILKPIGVFSEMEKLFRIISHTVKISRLSVSQKIIAKKTKCGNFENKLRNFLFVFLKFRIFFANMLLFFCEADQCEISRKLAKITTLSLFSLTKFHMVFEISQKSLQNTNRNFRFFSRKFSFAGNPTKNAGFIFYDTTRGRHSSYFLFPSEEVWLCFYKCRKSNIV